jgi:hypothetical protein
MFLVCFSVYRGPGGGIVVDGRMGREQGPRQWEALSVDLEVRNTEFHDLKSQVFTAIVNNDAIGEVTGGNAITCLGMCPVVVAAVCVCCSLVVNTGNVSCFSDCYPPACVGLRVLACVCCR